jgi:glucose-6-phosphate isomerase
MTLDVTLSEDTSQAVDRVIDELVSNRVASRIAASDATLWGERAVSEASIRLGWFGASRISRDLVEPIEELRLEFAARGLTRLVLCGMGGSSLAPEMFARTSGVDLVVLDTTHPGRIARVVNDDIDSTVVVVASKSGSTTETDSHRRAFESAFVDAGIDPASRIVVITDPGSPLDIGSREAGYRVFNADPNVGGRYSALTAFGLVTAGLAGVDISTLLDDADEAMVVLAKDTADNPGLILGAAMAAHSPHRDKMELSAENSSFIGIGEWIEQLVAESTGKDGLGVLPVIRGEGYPNVTEHDVVRVSISDKSSLNSGDDVVVSGPLGAQILLWEFATTVASQILGVNPFDQPDVESAKIATRTFLDGVPEHNTDAVRVGGVELSSHGYSMEAANVPDAVKELLDHVATDGYVSIHAYADNEGAVEADVIQSSVARQSGRPTTFGWAPRFLHSTGQYHKGGPEHGVFVQIVDGSANDLPVPGRHFSFGELLSAQANGDAHVLSQHGRPVLTLRALTEAGLGEIIDGLTSRQ